MNRLRLKATVALWLFLAGLIALPGTVRSEEKQVAPPSTMRAPRPGSREAATHSGIIQAPRSLGGGAFVKGPNRLYVPSRTLLLAPREDLVQSARWRGTRWAVGRYLALTGARPSPAPYQQLVDKIRRRAELSLRRDGKSLSNWKMVVLEGGSADQVNAAAWSGGVITIYRPLVDLCFQIANVVVNTKGPRAIDQELWRLSRWRRDKSANPVPDSQNVAPEKTRKRDVVAESILSRVVLHEMGHAASGHLELKDKKLIIPGDHTPRDFAASRNKEREADLFALKLGTTGAVRVPGVMPLFSYYNFISRPTFDEKGKQMIADWRTHPLDAERFNTQRKALEEAGRATGLPELLEPRIVLPRGGFALAKPEAAPVVKLPAPPPAAQVPLKKAAFR